MAGIEASTDYVDAMLLIYVQCLVRHTHAGMEIGDESVKTETVKNVIYAHFAHMCSYYHSNYG